MNIKRFQVSASIMLMLSMASHVVSQDWPQWRGVNRDAKVVGFNVPQSWPEQLKSAWKIEVGLGDATPALVDGRLYVFTKEGEEESLKCLDAGTGKLIWTSEGNFAPIPEGGASRHPGPRSTPAVDDGKVITVGVAGIISCFDVERGSLVWRNEDFEGAMPQFSVGMSPVIADGKVIAHVGKPGAGQYVAFDLASGNIVWNTSGDAPGYASPALMTVDGTNMVVFQGETKLTGVSLAEGDLLWEIETPVGTGRAIYSTSPVIDGQKVYYGGLNNGVNAIEITRQGESFSVRELWTNPELFTEYNTPVLKDGFLYGLSKLNKLFCINVSNGETAWIDDAAYQNFGSIIDAGSVLVAVSSTSDMIVYKPDDKAFELIAKMKVADTPVYAHPLLSGNRIYIKDEAGTLVMYVLD